MSPNKPGGVLIYSVTPAFLLPGQVPDDRVEDCLGVLCAQEQEEEDGLGRRRQRLVEQGVGKLKGTEQSEQGDETRPTAFHCLAKRYKV